MHIIGREIRFLPRSGRQQIKDLLNRPRTRFLPRIGRQQIKDLLHRPRTLRGGVGECPEEENARRKKNRYYSN